ncbi:MAG: hypothetical protein QOD31_2875 [Pseudonocardiales bacterium]|nr:hypothetical protein [Pseudonocardiales bacterium]
MPQVRRLPAAGAAALAVLALLTGCASVVNGDGGAATDARTTATATATPTGTSSPADTPTTSATAATSAGSAPATPATNLADLLAPAPPGSRPWDTPWSNNNTPTLDEFVAHVYPAKSTELATSQLKAQGIEDIAHLTWISTDANQADTILLRFATPAGAVSRYRSATTAKGQDTGQLHFDLPSFTEAVGYYSPVLDELGDVRTIVYGRVGAIVVEVFFYSPAKLDKAAAIAATTAQLQLLPA